jgi:hypothetical protein
MANQQLFGCGRMSVGALALLMGVATGSRAQPTPPTQAQVAYQFLTELLQADYPAAYRRVAPEVQTALRPAAFAKAAAPLWAQGQQRGSQVTLYKLGTRLSSRGGHGQWFYSFSFANDSLRKPPPVLLEVIFRDTTARQVLSFGLRQH